MISYVCVSRYSRASSYKGALIGAQKLLDSGEADTLVNVFSLLGS